MIGAKDPIDRALVVQYAEAKTNKLDEERIKPDEMWENINRMALSTKIHSDLTQKLNIPKPRVALKGFWDK